MINFLSDVYDFHKKFGFSLPKLPRPMDPNLRDLKIRHLLEEAQEYFSAPDAAHRLDALLDTVYVALGAALLEFPQGTIEEAWEAIQTANMSKIRTNKAADSTRNSSFDVIKPYDFQAPDLKTIIEKALKNAQNLEIDNP